MKTFIIGDIHGCSREFSALLEILNPDPEADRLILLGDLFDRGPESWEVFLTVRSLADIYGDDFFLLREKMSFTEKRMWDRVGRRATVKSFKSHGRQMEEAIPWLKANCRDYYRDDGIQCVHAGVKTEPLETNDRDTMFHDHSEVLRNRYAGRLTVTGHIAIRHPTWFAGDEKTVEKLPYREERPLPEKGVICIDTGCGKGGRLTAMVVNGDMYYLESTAEA